MYLGNCMTLKGQKHRQFKAGCQDTSGYVFTDLFSIIAVADGHGGTKHFRSKYGSETAVRVAISVISDYLNKPTNYINIQKKPELHIAKIEDKIEKQWKDTITKHANSNPLTRSERAVATDSNIRNRNPLPDYGTTLAIAVFCRTFAFCIYVGDSRIMVVPYTGEPHLLPKNDLCQNDKTTSMCDDTVLFDHNYWNGADIPASVICFSDGFESTYQEKQVVMNACGILSVMNKEQYWYGSVAKQLSKIASSGTLDDTSIAILYSDSLDLSKVYRDYFGKELPLRDDLSSTPTPSKKVQTDGIYDGDKMVESGYWVSPSGREYYSDSIVNGYPSELVDCMEPSIRYVGDVINFDKNGFGKEYIMSDLIYEGQFKNGQYNGEGTFRPKDNYGLWYVGSFINGLLEGFGKEYVGETLNYEGQFHEGRKHGEGTLYIRGVPQKALFDNGKNMSLKK